MQCEKGHPVRRWERGNKVGTRIRLLFQIVRESSLFCTVYPVGSKFYSFIYLLVAVAAVAAPRVILVTIIFFIIIIKKEGTVGTLKIHIVKSRG